jgi:hypothetical protein
MLKVLKNSDNALTVPETADSPVSDSWVLVRTSSKNNWTSLKLPITIGHSTENDIFVNAPTMNPISKVIINNQSALKIVDVQTLLVHDPSSLKIFGISVSGPFCENPEQMSLPRRTLSLVQSHEANLNYKVSKKLGKLNVLPQAQLGRFLMYACAVAFLTLGLNTVLFDTKTGKDLSQQPISLSAGNVRQLNIKSTSERDPYARGAAFKFKIKDITPDDPYVLTMTLSGLDIAEELSLKVNGNPIGTTPALIACVDVYCQRDFAVDARKLVLGDNTISIDHTAVDSPYEIRNVFFRKMESATADDIEHMNHLLASAERYYEERHLMIQNIKTAKDSILEIEQQLMTKIGADSIKPKFNVAKAKILDAFNEISKDLQFKLQKELKLGQNKAAISSIDNLLKLYPDPASKQNSMLLGQKKSLMEVGK